MAEATRGELLLEVRAEEIPARMLAPATEELGRRVADELSALGLAPAEVETAFTPRRLVLVLRGLPERQDDREEVVTGPPVRAAFAGDGSPTRAAEGFAAKVGLPLDGLERIETERGEYLAARVVRAGRPTRELLAEVLPRVLASLGWAKTMRWGTGEGPWVRPVHGVVALFAGEVVPFALFGVAAGVETVGHPVLSPKPFGVRGARDYLAKLERRHVEVRPAERRRRLAEGMAERAAAAGGTLVEDPALLDKLAAICEIPGVLEGRFDDLFLGLPREVLTASLRDHQSALTVEREGRLAPLFLTVMDRSDDPRGLVRAGNEWVVAARLADARFFYQEDRKAPLADRLDRLASLTFHERLGSYRDKAERLAVLVGFLCDELGWEAEREPAQAAARLLKADLVTEMVKEFTSLQGVMGGIYAREDGHPEEIWQAVGEQYLPAAADDPVPGGRVGQLCGLADRMDTLVGIFGLGLVPTGSRDPFGLRRAAQGAIRIVLEGDLPLDLELLAAHAAHQYGDLLTVGREDLLTALRPFLHDRIRHLLGREGFAWDEIEAALAAGTGNLADLRSRVAALHRVREQPRFLSIVLAAKRIANILKDSEERELDPQVLREPAERDLLQALRALRGDVEEAAEAREYDRALAAIASLAEVLDRFFVEVLVMAEDPRLRNNRLALLQEIRSVVSRTAELTELQVDKAEYR